MLFACGPLAQEGHRRRVFGERLPVFPARMLHWARYRGADGLEFARQSRGATIDGFAVALTAEEIAAADRSVSSSNLQRAVTLIEIDGSLMWSFVYTRRGEGELIA